MEALTDQKVMQLLKSGDCRNSFKLGRSLSEREMEIVKLLADGLTTRQQLAGRLSLSENTVRNHLSNIQDKLNVNDSTAIVVYYYKFMQPTEAKNEEQTN